MVNIMHLIIGTIFLMISELAAFSQQITFEKNNYDSGQVTLKSDSLIMITSQQFDSLIVNSISQLNLLSIVGIQDYDHIRIIRLINTLDMTQDHAFKNGIYADFMKLIKEKDYEKVISSYYDWTPNKGMGMYFPKLQVELGGTPNLYSRYTIQ